MSVYSVIYYLNENHSCGCGCENHDHSNHEYIDIEDRLVGKIKELGAWAYFMPSSYLVNTTYSAEEILSSLQPIVGKSDLIFVSKVDSKTSASVNPEVISWIEKCE